MSTDDSVPESQSKHEESARLFQPAKNMVASNSTQTWLKQVGLIHQVLPECSNIGKKQELLGSRFTRDMILEGKNLEITCIVEEANSC